MAGVTLAPMAAGYVALPLRAATVSRCGFLPAGGLAADADSGWVRTRKVQAIGPPRLTLVAADCDPALPLLEAPLGLLDPTVAFSLWPCPSREGLGLAADGLVHVAGAHLRGRGSEYNVGPADELLPEGSEVFGFCSWREGLALRSDLADGISGVGEVARRGLRLVNREPGAEARSVLDRELADASIDGGQLRRLRHAGDRALAGGRRHRRGTGRRWNRQRARGPGVRPGFRPADRRAFRPGHPAGQAGTREVQALLKVLSSAWLLDQLASLPGYDPARCGERIATLRTRSK